MNYINEKYYQQRLKFWQKAILFFKMPRYDIDGDYGLHYKRLGDKIYITDFKSIYETHGDRGYTGWSYWGKGEWMFSIHEGALLKYPGLSMQFKWFIIPIFFYLRINKFKLVK